MSEERVIKQEIPFPKEYGKRKFHPGMDMLQSVSGVGDASVQSIKQKVESGDENYEAGLQEERKFVRPAMDVAAVAGAKLLVKGIRAELNQITLTSEKVYELLREGQLSMVDLGDKEMLKERLEKMEGLTAFQKNQISKFRETAYDLMMVRDALERQRNVTEGLEEPLKVHLKSKGFFDLEQQKTNELLKVYFKSNRNEVLRNVNPAGLREKDIEKLLKSSEKNGFTEVDRSALRLAAKQMKYREARIRIGRVVNIKKRIEMVGAYSRRMDDAAGSGLNQMVYSAQLAHSALAVGKFGLKAGVVSASFAAKYTGAAYLAHKLQEKGSAGAEHLKAKAVEGMKSSSLYQTAQKRVDTIKTKATDTKEQIEKKLEENTAVQKYKAAQEKAKERAKAAGKKVRQTQAAAAAAGREVRQGVDVVLSPARFVGKVFHGIGTFFGKVKLVLLAGVGIIIGAFLIIVVLTNAVLTIFQSETNAVVSVILTEEEDFVEDMTAVLRERMAEKRQEAMEIATGSPMNPAVLEGRSITRYGYPDVDDNWTNGSKIVYLDGSGRVIGNGRNNIKDCIAMAYVIMDGDFDSDRIARDELIIALWEMMNPDVTYQESDIYTCPYGCDSFSYSCDSWGDYGTMDRYRASGVGFYGVVEGYSEYGDGYTVICNGCKGEKNQTIYHEVQIGSGAASVAEGCENYSVSYECYGHSVTVCYGHKDVEVYVKTLTMEDIFADGRLPEATGASFGPYVDRFQGWTEESREWAVTLVNGDWLELYGVDPVRN